VWGNALFAVFRCDLRMTEFVVYNQKFKMERQSDSSHWLPAARHYGAVKESL